MSAAFATSVPSSPLTLSSLGFCERPTSWFSPASQSPYLLSPLFRLLSLYVTLQCRLSTQSCHLFSLQTLSLGDCSHRPPPSVAGLPSHPAAHKSDVDSTPLCRCHTATLNSTGRTELSLFPPKIVPPPGFPIFKNGPRQKLSTNTHCHVVK